jgi:D-3-phosphoglycerate dehydrogenase
MKVLIADKIAQEGIDILEAAGHEVVVKTGATSEELKSAIADAHGIIVRSETKITNELLDGAPLLIAAGRAGVGIDTLGVDECTAHGVQAFNSPEANIVSAAELAIGHIVGAARAITPASTDMKAGEWPRGNYSGTQISGSDIGIIGFGGIGTLVATRLDGWGANVHAWDPFVTQESMDKYGVTKVESVKELFEKCNIITIHVGLFEGENGTRNLVNREILKSARPDLLLVNVARGGIVDEEAFVDFLDENPDARGAFDVFVEEPPKPGDKLVAHPRMTTTAHMGASTVQAQRQAALDISELMVRALNGEIVETAVNVGRQKISPSIAPYIVAAQVCGTIAAGLMKDPSKLSEVSVSPQGVIAADNCEPLRIAGLAGALGVSSQQRISLVNAPSIAEEKSIKHDLEPTPKKEGNQLSRVQIVAKAGSETSSVSAAVTESGELQLVEIDGVRMGMNITNAAHLVLIANDDAPGMIGKVGTTMGDAGINIFDMQVGRNPSSQHEAIMIAATSEKPSDEVLTSIAAISGIKYAKAVDIA